MMRCVLWFILILVANFNLEPQETDSTTVAPSPAKKLPFVGTWKVVSQTSGTSIAAIPKNEIFLLDNLFAEYDRTKSSRTNLMLYNVNWTGTNTEFTTCLMRSPVSSLNISRDSEKNIAGYAYLQCRANSAILVISETKLETNPFELSEPIVMADAHARVYTLFRTTENPKTREVHLENLLNNYAGILGDLSYFEDNPNVGGFLEELAENLEQEPIK